MPFQICKKFCKFLNNLIFNQEKLKICKSPLTGSFQIICNFFRKTCAIRFLMSQAFQKAKFYQNLTSGSGSKQRFSLLQEKGVIQALCLRTQSSIRARFCLRGGLWVCTTIQKISTASDQYFLSYVKKTTAGIGLKWYFQVRCKRFVKWGLSECVSLYYSPLSLHELD